jgi:hypothetical protein
MKCGKKYVPNWIEKCTCTKFKLLSINKRYKCINNIHTLNLTYCNKIKNIFDLIKVEELEITNIKDEIHLLKNIKKLTINKEIKNKGEMKKLIKNNKQVKIIVKN